MAISGRPFIGWAALLLLAPSAAAQAAESEVASFESPRQRAVLIELFTSEGCASCPPADARARSLQVAAELWRGQVPVVFHVDYWDHLGWKDPFAQPAFTRRQQLYAASWGGQAYTPCFAINGEAWTDWSPLKPFPKPSGKDAGILRVQLLDDGAFAVAFTPQRSAGLAYTAHLALLGFGVVSSVTAGENRGKELHHDFLALAYASQPMKSAADGSSAAKMRLEKRDPDPSKERAIACWVTEPGSLNPVQATGGYLP